MTSGTFSRKTAGDARQRTDHEDLRRWTSDQFDLMEGKKSRLWAVVLWLRLLEQREAETSYGQGRTSPLKGGKRGNRSGFGWGLGGLDWGLDWFRGWIGVR